MNHRSAFSRFALFVAAIPAMSGCVLLGDGAADVTNTCSSDADCHGGACANVFGMPTCIATQVSLPGLLIEVRPSAEADFGANTPFIVPFGGDGLISQDSVGLIVDHDVGLSQVNVSPIEFAIDYPYKGCPLTQKGTMAVELGFYRDAGFVGLPDYETGALPMTDLEAAYTTDLPPGSYDVHVVPIAPEGCMDAPPPPTFIRNVDLAAGGKLALSLDHEPRKISGTIGFPKGQDLTGWMIEVIEPKRGKRVSNAQLLSVEPLSLYANYNLSYYWDWGIESSPILRLLPPDGVTAPKLLWEIAALSPLNPSEANIQANLVLIDLDAEGRDVEGFVLDSHGKPVVSTVDLTSLELSGLSSSNANYNVLVDTDQDGRFLTKVPPGRYQVIAHPTSDFSKAITTVIWELFTSEAGCFCGRTINLVDKSIVSGKLTLPNGNPLSIGTASIYPAWSPVRSYLASRLVADGAATQIASSPLDFFGRFALPTDPDLVDLIVVPPVSSFYPWVVRSQLDIKANDTGADIFDLGTLDVTYPVVLGGRVHDPADQSLSGATLRAWMPVSSGGGTNNVVIQVGETTTGADGRYVLPLAPTVAEGMNPMSP